MRRSAFAAAVIFGVVPIVLIVGLTLGQARISHEIDRTRAAGRQSRNISDAAVDLEHAVENTELGARGFMLAGDQASLASYESGRRDSVADLQTLIRVTGDEPELHKLLDPLASSVNQRLEELAAMVAARHAQPAGGVDPGALDDFATRQTLEILNTFVSVESDSRDSRRQSIDQAVIQANQLSLLAGITAFAALSCAAFALYGAYRRSRMSETILQATLDSVREGVAAFDDANRLIAWNQLFVKLHRIPADIIRQRMKAADLEEIERARPDPIAHDLLSLKGEALAAAEPVLIERSRGDGTIVEVSLSPSPDGGFVTSYIDVTEARRTESLYRQAQRMEALGRMTGGVAHDFNNLLTIVIGNLELLKRRLPVGESYSRLIEHALQGADRGAKLTQQLLAFARRQPLEPEAVALAKLLPDLMDLIRKSLGSKIELHSVVAPDLWQARLDPTQFESALLNLALNARDAMAEGGSITIGASNVSVGTVAESEPGDLKAGDYVLIEVADTGSGMTPEVLARAFEPFFTTKPDGKGTGLGLSMVHGFAHQSGGHLRIASTLGTGTTVALYLPRDVAAPAAAETALPGQSELQGSGTILVVEDDAAVRDAAVELLTELGFRTVEAIDGQSALDLLRGPQRIDLLFSDVVMPGPVSSRALAESASRIRPDLPILFTSGYTYDEINAEGQIAPGIELLSKPYRAEQLMAKIQSCLQRKQMLSRTG